MSEDASVQVEEHKGFCNHWSSYRLSLRQTWRELKLPTRSSINWMIDIFAGTSTDHKADFTFCLNAGFYLQVFNMALVYAVWHLVMIDLWYYKPITTPVSNADLQEGDELEGTELYIKAFAEAVWIMATDNLVDLCFLVFDYGRGCALDYFNGYLLYSSVLMSKNRCVACCLYVHFMDRLIVNGSFIWFYFLVDSEDNRDLKSVLSKNDIVDDEVFKLLGKTLYADWTSILLELMMIKCAFHLRFNGKTTSETETLLQDKHEV